MQLMPIIHKKALLLLLLMLTIFWGISTYSYLSRYYQERDICVGIFYYAWYGEKRHWNDCEDNAVIDQPYTRYYQGYYSSLNETVVYSQLKLIEMANIDFLLVSWFYPGSYEDQATKLLFEVTRKNNLNVKIALMIEPIDDYDVNATKLEQIKTYIMENYVKPYKQHYFHWEGKPLLAFFVPLNPTRNDPEYSFKVIGEQPYADWPYWSVPPKITEDGVTSVLPRYDDSRLPRERKIVIDETYREELYNEQWRFILNNKDKLKLVLIATWNEYHERTMIEPHIDATADPEFYFPDYLYQKTCEYVKLLKEKPFPTVQFYSLPSLILLMFILYKSFQIIMHGNGNSGNKQVIQQMISIGLISRFLLIFIAFLSNTIFGLRTPFEGENLPDYNIPLLNLFARWDSGYYINIARNGYTVLSQWAFRPLFPLMLKSINFLFTAQDLPTPINLIIIGFFMNNVLYIISLLLFYRLSLKISPEEAFIFTLIFAIYPTSFIFSAVYPESLFMTLLLLSYYHLEEGKILFSSIFMFLAGLCRPEGFTASLIYLIKGVHKREKRKIYGIAFSISLSSLPIFLIYSLIKTGSIFTPFEAEALWARTGIIEMILRIGKLQLNVNPGLSLPYLILNLPLFSMIITFLLYYYISMGSGLYFSEDFYRKIFPYIFHATLYIVFISFFVDYISIARLSLFAFPIIWIIAHKSSKNKTLLYNIIIINIVLLTFYTALHVNWYHVT
ncbi:MAG: mannosyltransferase family protein [Candidatus Bathyarchaeia archaeon]